MPTRRVSDSIDSAVAANRAKSHLEPVVSARM